MAQNKKLREGYTTGSCAAAAAKASAIRALCGECPEKVEITTPEDLIFSFPILCREKGICGVIKDAGDDPDSTDGIEIDALAEISESEGEIRFAAGEGIGTVTLPGLKVPVGEPAINPVPRAMIEKAVRDVIGARGALITVSAPQGKEIAKRTFNPRLGIVGGISILGTTGRVKPMNEAALLESFTLELNTHAAEGRRAIAVAFAGTGEKALRSAYRINTRAVVLCGNYIGYILDEAARLGITHILFGGHPGKLLKVAAGSFNTYNRTAAGGKEALCTQAAIAGASAETVKEIYSCRVSSEAMKIVERERLGYLWSILAEITAKRCMERSFGDLKVSAAFIDNSGRILGACADAEDFAEEIRNGK